MIYTIAMDGPVGAGKSSVASQVAQKLGILHLDTGAMYRAFAWKALKEGIALDDEQIRRESLARETGAMVTLIKEYIALPVRERSAHTDVFCRQAAERLSAVECALDGLCPLPLANSKA